MASKHFSQMTPAERITNDLCPECGQSLIETSPQWHKDTHWERRAMQTPEDHSEAAKRIKMLEQYIAERNKKAE